MAKRLNVSTHVIYYWLQHGMLKFQKRGPGFSWDIQLDEQKEAELRQRIQQSGHLANIKEHE